MKTLPSYIWLVIGAVVLFGLLWTSREGFVPEIDDSNKQRTVMLEDSSHRQETNNFTPTPSASYPAIYGVQGKDRVNQWQGFVI
jgi:hypothetical protein